jgi:hypothetical protein
LATKTFYQIGVTAIGDGVNFSSGSESTKVKAVTGIVAITGNTWEGTTVSINDSGLPAGTILTYSWKGGEAGSLTEKGTNSTYKLTAGDRSYSAQKYLSLTVTLTADGTTYEFVSNASPVYTYPNATGGSVTAPSPAPRGTYTSGKYKVGQTVIGHAWSVMGTPWPTLNYTWWICDNSPATANPQSSGGACVQPSESATGTATRNGVPGTSDLGGYGFSYVVTSQAAGKFLTFTATLSNAATVAQSNTPFTFTQSRTMNSGIIQTTPVITGSPATPNISGTPQVGKKLTAATVSAVPVNSNPMGKISYQWMRSDTSTAGTFSAIPTATRTTYTPIGDDQNKYLQVIATATNNAGDTATATSATPLLINYVIPSGLVVALDTTTARVGETLTAVITSVTGFPEPTYIYQWQRCTTTGTSCTNYSNISGATLSTHRTVLGDLNKYIRISVKATNAVGTSASVISSNRAGLVRSP